MPSLIYGFGVTGKSFQRYLEIKGEEFEIYDTLHSDALKIASKIEDGFYKNIYVSPSVRFWIITLVLILVALATLKLR